LRNPSYSRAGWRHNTGIRAAFEAALGKPVTVPPYYDVMGAWGAALLAKSKMAGGGKTAFCGFSGANRQFGAKSIECTGCPNLCEVIEISADGKRLALWGDRCGKWSAKTGAAVC
jgi:hypothetical protein